MTEYEIKEEIKKIVRKIRDAGINIGEFTDEDIRSMIKEYKKTEL